MVMFDELQKVWENALKMQNSILSTIATTLESAQKWSILQEDIAVFRAKIQSGGRISIPEPDRNALNLKEGDIVKVVVIKEKGGEKDGV